MIFFYNKRAISFIEVMLTAVILSSGLIGVYRAFFTSIQVNEHLAHRLHAANFLNNQIALMQKDFKETGRVHPSYLKRNSSLVFQNKKIDFTYQGAISSAENLEGLYQLDAEVFWEEKFRSSRIQRSVYLLTGRAFDEF